jgi:glycosyltransferase involved in cell wall biosynthesis
MAGYLPDAIESVFKQTVNDLEIIVVDDGSTDNTKEVIKPYLDRISFMEIANGGPSKARNRAIRASQSEYVAFLDADDTWYPHKLERQLKIFLKNQQVSLVHSDAFINGTDKSQENKLWFSGHTRVNSGWVFGDLLNECFIILSSVIVKRDCLEKVGVFDEDLKCWEGYDLWLRIAYENQIGFVDEPLFSRRIHGSNLFFSETLNRISGLITVMTKWDNKAKKLSEDDKKSIKQQLKTQYCRLGGYYLNKGQPAKARIALINSLKHGSSLRSAGFLSLSILPPFAISYIRRTKHGVRELASKMIKI